ncbi:MAG: hypothetical protein ACRC57_13690 [Sarcina sp.]
MLAKIGIENLEEQNFDIYSTFSYDFNVELENTFLKQNMQKIISLMISPTIDLLEVKGDEFKVWINLEIKAVFLLENGKLSLIQKILKFYRNIKFEKKFEGLNLEELYLNKRLEYDLLVLNFESVMIEKTVLRINSILSIIINYKKDYSIAIVAGKNKNDLIILFDNGEKFKYIENNSENKILEVKWLLGKKFIFYKLEKDKYNISKYNLITQKKELMCDYFDKIYSFDYVTENLICIEGVINNVRGIYLYNFIKENLEILIESDEELVVEEVTYITELEKLYFIKIENETKSICSINLDGSFFSEHMNLKKNSFYILKEQALFFIFEKESMRIYDKLWNELRKVDYPKGSFDQIINIDVCNGKYLAAILTLENMKSNIYLYDFEKNNFTDLNFCNDIANINKVKFNSNGDFLIISKKGLRENNLYKLTFDGKLTELFANKTKNLDIYI